MCKVKNVSLMTGDDTRVSDRERQDVVDRLSAACGEGLLTLEEFSDRAGEAYAAISRQDLDEVTRDLRLPATFDSRSRADVEATSARSPGRRWIVALFGSDHRRGRWRAEPRLRTVAVMGSAHVDLREAFIDGSDIAITACALMGTVHVIVPHGIPVVVGGFMLMGTRRNDVAPGREVTGGPRIRVYGLGAFGTIRVESRSTDVS